MGVRNVRGFSNTKVIRTSPIWAICDSNREFALEFDAQDELWLGHAVANIHVGRVKKRRIARLTTSPNTLQRTLKVRRLSIWILALLVSSSLPRPCAAQENTATDNPPSRVARISYLKGKVSFLRAGLDQWSQAALNFPATTGDRIYTDRGARAELEVGRYAVRLSGATDLTITNLNDQIMQLGLEQGTLRLSVYQLPSGETVEIDTPNGALTIQRPGKYRVDVDPSGDRTTVRVNEGSLEITGPGVSQTVESGQAVRLTGQDPIQVESLPMRSSDSFDSWSEERDRRLASSGSSKYVSPLTPGCDDLDAYGHWVEVIDYGPVWYPIVPAGWVPYRFGHWVWIDPWG